MKNENLATISTIAIILAVLASLTILLVMHIIAFAEAGIFIAVIAAPLTAMAGVPIYKAALAAPSPEQTQAMQQQSQMLHNTLSQSIQALTQVVQPAPAPVPVAVVTQGYNAPSSLQPNPGLVQQMPFPQAPQQVARSWGDTGLVPTVPTGQPQ